MSSPSDQALLEDLADVNSLVGRPATAAEYREHGEWSSRTLRTRFGSWAEAHAELGVEDLEAERGEERRICTKREALEDLERVNSDLGRPATQPEYEARGEYSAGVPIERFDSWVEAQAELGHDVTPGYSDEEILDSLERVSSELGRPATKAEFEERGVCHPETVTNRFGSWAEAHGRVGNEVPGYGSEPTDEELTRDLRRVNDELGEPASVHQYNECGEYSHATQYNHFGSWREAQEAAGADITDRTRYSDEELLEDLAGAMEGDGDITMREYRGRGGFAAQTLQNRFGSWGRAKKLARGVRA